MCVSFWKARIAASRLYHRRNLVRDTTSVPSQLLIVLDSYPKPFKCKFKLRERAADLITQESE
jgi:hypothetical protein